MCPRFSPFIRAARLSEDGHSKKADCTVEQPAWSVGHAAAETNATGNPTTLGHNKRTLVQHRERILPLVFEASKQVTSRIVTITKRIRKNFLRVHRRARSIR